MWRTLPVRALNWYRETIKGRSLKSVFTHVFEAELWRRGGESVSGPGSELRQTGELTRGLNALLRETGIRSLLDIPCGDFNWMRRVDLEGIDYLGADIVDGLIAANRKAFPFRFEVLDITRDPLPRSDLVLVRDCLVHLPFKDIHAAIRNIKRSGSRYLLATTFTGCEKNRDIHTGGWRKLNLRRRPFRFPEPLLVINENCTEDHGRNTDKCMALWEIRGL